MIYVLDASAAFAGKHERPKEIGFIVPHETVRLTWQASQRNKISWAFYKSQAGTQRFDVGCGATSGNARLASGIGLKAE